LDALIQNFQHLIGAIGVLGEATPRALDAVVRPGEGLAVRMIAVGKILKVLNTFNLSLYHRSLF
jgi:hypothetical protein